MSIFEGSAVALVTPFKKDGSVNKDKLFELVEYHIENETDAIVVCGTTGEKPTLKVDEHLDAIKWCVEAAKGRIPIIAGTGSNDTDHSIYMSTTAAATGADALLLSSPYYNKATQNGLIASFSAIADAAGIPCILYNVPSRTGVNIQPETAVTLARTCENIVAIKEASGDISQIAKLAALADGCIDIYSGNDDQITPVLSLGGKGVISVLANIAPKDTHDLVMSYLNGSPAESTRLQLKANALVEALFCEVNPIPVKAAMNFMGMDVGSLRLQLTEMEPQNKEKLKKAMIDYGLKLA